MLLTVPPESSGCAQKWPEHLCPSLCPADKEQWPPCHLVPLVSAANLQKYTELQDSNVSVALVSRNVKWIKTNLHSSCKVCYGHI